MRIVVNHLTRMRGGHICVAGIDLDTGRHIRPVLPASNLPVAALTLNGGSFGLGNVVDLGDVLVVGQPPEIEDRQVTLSRVRVDTRTSAAEFWNLLQRVARPRLSNIFGGELQRHGWTFCTDAGHGSASLGVLAIPRSAILYPVLMPDGRVRLGVRRSDGDLSVPLTDVRLHAGERLDQPREDALRYLAGQLAAGQSAFLSVGLSRPFSAHPNDPPRHWLQVNNIHLENDPLWDGTVPVMPTVLERSHPYVTAK